MTNEPIKGDGWAVSSIEDLGEGPGFRKVRSALGVTEFGVNAIVVPPGFTSRRHYHERQQELYLVLKGELEFELDDARHTLGPGGLVRVDPSTVRSLRNTSETEEALYYCVGGQGGYVGRDGQVP
ncbi:MAG TPA: cupin domain-containing protein [Solirubrobacteraceae bacterium]|nr:cupin domain-containing protein [Solirubrobacteraceae bacterium]